MWFWVTHCDLSQVKTFDPVQNQLVIQIDPVTGKPVESAYGLKTRKAHRNKDELDGIAATTSATDANYISGITSAAGTTIRLNPFKKHH